MELATLQKDMIAAMKARDKERKEAISSLVSAVKKAAIDGGCRDDIPSSMVDQVILKELKSVKQLFLLKPENDSYNSSSLISSLDTRNPFGVSAKRPVTGCISPAFW